MCNGLVRSVLRIENPQFLFLPVKAHNFETVRSMYMDDCRIVCIPVQSDADVPHLSQVAHARKIVRSGFEKTRTDWDVSFYDSIGLPFSERWSSFKILRNPHREEALRQKLSLGSEPYIVIHDLSSVGKFQQMVVDSRGLLVIS